MIHVVVVLCELLRSVVFASTWAYDPYGARTHILLEPRCTGQN